MRSTAEWEYRIPLELCELLEHGDLPLGLIANPHLDRDYTLVAPRVTGVKLPLDLFKSIAGALITHLSSLQAVKKEELIPKKRARELLASCTVESWGRLRALWGGDTMLASELVLRELRDRRDATFVKVSDPTLSEVYKTDWPGRCSTGSG